MQISSSAPLGFWRRARIGIAVFNLVFVLSLMWLEWRVGENWWFSTLVTYVPQHAVVLPSLLFALIAAKKRERFEGRVNALALSLGIFSLLGFQAPLPNFVLPARSPLHTSKPRVLRVMDYNILAGVLGIEAVAQTIRAQNPDIICLQEAGGYPDYSDSTPQLQPLLPEYQMVRAQEVTTFSRFPIRSSQSVPLGGNTNRAILETIIEVDGQPLAIINAHLWAIQFRGGLPLWKIPYRANMNASNAMRSEEFALVRNLARRSGLPFIITGDFNTPPRGMFYRQMAREFHDAFGMRGLGFGQTYPARFPLLRIDYQWSRADWPPLRAWTVLSFASDHRPLVAEYLW